MKRKTPTVQPVRCSCEGGGNRAPEHARPGAKAADHGDPFSHVPGCVHSDLQRTTAPAKRRKTIQRIRLT
jgi:hypothetical protein